MRHQLDTRGMRCPWPALRLARIMRQSAPGDEIVMIVDDPKAESEVETLSRERGWALARERRPVGCVFTLSL
jgi:tRNA 2-thiouridine synthesizing protein A